MLEIKDIEHLAKLARIELTEDEKVKYLKDISAILGYVDQIQEIVSKSGEKRIVGDLRNVIRTDEVLNTPNSNTESIVAEFPRKEGDRLKVKKILAN
jgi:aspartyl-tRNA(Asn)/glutamyl-tRNA(Gln) amidotransferase subunit C